MNAIEMLARLDAFRGGHPLARTLARLRAFVQPRRAQPHPQ
jgi:hypothetical protein